MTRTIPTLLRSFFVAMAMFFASVAYAPVTARAGDDGSLGQSYYAGLSCGQLWYERNRIFAGAGYCFKSRRGLSVFGRGCFPPYGRLSSQWQNVVNEIKYFEKQRGC